MNIILIYILLSSLREVVGVLISVGETVSNTSEAASLISSPVKNMQHWAVKQSTCTQGRRLDIKIMEIYIKS